jgi:uncharacterized protein (DUF362 family)
MSRRGFLSLLGAAAGTVASGAATSLVTSGCQSVSSFVPAATSAVATSAFSTAATAAPTVAAAAGKPQVAIAQATNYDPKLIRKHVRSLLDALGGLKGVVKSGDRVAIKTNLTGGLSNRPLPGVSAIESYVTHPEIVRALGEAVREAGAKELFIVEAVYEDASWRVWGYEDVAKSLGATLIDLNNTRPYNDFAQVPVGNGAFIYQNFTFNHILQDVDVFMSVPKMKCHNSAGVTLSMKNLFGLVPARFYRLSEQHNYRSAFHGQNSETGNRVPRVILDLNRARPIHFALIDGIKTTEGGEGPWIKGMAAVEPGLLIAGINPLATDAVATAAMGFDPTAPAMKEPFVRSDNHLAIAAELGLGTNKLSDIQTIGPKVSDVVHKFKPSW